MKKTHFATKKNYRVVCIKNLYCVFTNKFLQKMLKQHVVFKENT